MIKLIVWLALIVGLIWALTTRSRKPGADKPRQPASRLIVECANCGLRIPVDEAVTESSLPYCSETHRRLGPR